MEDKTTVVLSPGAEELLREIGGTNLKDLISGRPWASKILNSKSSEGDYLLDAFIELREGQMIDVQRIKSRVHQGLPYGIVLLADGIEYLKERK